MTSLDFLLYIIVQMLNEIRINRIFVKLKYYCLQMLGISACGTSGSGFVFKSILNDRYFIKGITSTYVPIPELLCDTDEYTIFTLIAVHNSLVRDLVVLNQP